MNAPTEHWSGPIREDTDGGGRRTPAKSLLNMTLGILVSLLLLASAGFFYVAIQRDEAVTAQCMRAVESIRATQMLAAQWSVEVGKVKNEVNSNFDVLANFVDRMDPHMQVIHDSQNAMPNLPSDIKWALNGYVQRLKAREERIERFKSGFAIVRNSRRFIPREGAELAEAARDGGYGRVEAATHQILERTQSFLRQPTESQSHRMEQAMSTLAESAAGTPLHTQAETLNKHVSALLRHHGLTEQRFEDVMRTDLEDRAGRVIGLLDADHQQSRTKRRYFDYGFWASLGIAVFYWCTLAMQWMGRRRQRNAAAGTQEPVPAKGVPPHWGMDAALATAGGSGFPLGDAGRAGEGERPEQSRQAQGPARRAKAGRAPAATGGRAGSTLMERLKARDGAHRTQREESGREDAGEQGTAVAERRDVPAPAGEEDASAGGSAEPEPSLEERLEALKAELEAQKRASGTDRRVQHGDPVPDDAENAREQGAPVVERRDVPADRDAGASGNGRASATLEERLKSLKTERDDRRAQHGGPVPEDAGEKGAAAPEVRDASADASASVRTNPALEERLKALKAGTGMRRAQEEPPAPGDAGEQGAAAPEVRDASADASASVRTNPALEERLKALKAGTGMRRAQEEPPAPGDAGEQGAAAPEVRDASADASASVRTNPALEERLKALKAGTGMRRAQEEPPAPGDAGEQGAAATGGEQAQAHTNGGGPGIRLPAMTVKELEERLKSMKADAGVRQAREEPSPPVPEDTGEQGGAAVTGGEWAQAPAGVAPAPAPATTAREGAPSMVQTPPVERTPADSPILQAQARTGAAEVEPGAAADVRGREADATPAPSQPDGSEFVHQATREAILDRLQEIEQEIRAAADAAEQAEHTRRNKDGKGDDQDAAWTAAAGRMAGARWAVRALLKEVDRLPVPAAPRGAPDQVDMRDLVEKLLDALAGEDRKRIDATLVPGTVTRGNPRALETATDIIVQHALEGARLHPGGEGYVTLTLVQESDGVHVTCLDHGPEGDKAGNRRSLALVVARSLIEGQGGEMEITPYPRYGTMVRLRLPLARSSM